MADTSLKVVVRARPMNSRETREGARKCVEYYEASNQIVINGAATFAFDLIFPDNMDQETVYEKTALPLLDRIFAGFNATVLAYGQTGSGKTYTMGTEDYDGTDQMRRGIVPRLVDNLFQKIEDTGFGEAFKVSVSMYEVYGESVFDLLRPDKVKLNVHGDEKNCTIVNLTTVPVTDLKGALKQLATGCHYRTKAETAMNAMSSRSHAVFTIYIEKIGVPDSDNAFSAKLQLVDLAGSERLKKTEAEGNRMKEGININAGLLILSQVISALATKAKHIPYRNSVITRVLQDSLGGNSFTVFLACISPADTNAQETLNTLRYADRAKQIKNKPVVNKNPKAEEISMLQAQLKRLQKENADLRNGIAPVDTKIDDIAHKAEMFALKEENLKKIEEIREKNIHLSDKIVKISILNQKLVKLEAEKGKLVAILTDAKNLLQNEEEKEAGEVLQAIQQIIGAESEADSILNEEDGSGDDSQFATAMDDTIYDAERLPELQSQLEEIEKQIAMKDESRKNAIETQKEFIVELQQREEEKTQLVVRVSELETEITKLKTDSKKVNTATKLAEERRQKLKELEKQHAADKKSLMEFKKLQETRKRMEEMMKKTEDELKNLKLQRLKLLREQRAEASKFQAFKLKHERELAQVKSKMQKQEMSVQRQKRMDEQKLAVLQQRLAESNRANKALKELNLKRANRKEAPTDANTLQLMIEDELELTAAAQRCHNLYLELRRQRGEIQQQIDKLEAQRFNDGKKRASLGPDCTIVLDGEEEFENGRMNKLNDLRASLDDVNLEIQDLLKNSTISEDEKNLQKSKKWEKVPADFRPLFDAILSQAITQVKKAEDLEFQMTKQKNDFKAKLELKTKLEEKKKRDDEEMKMKYLDLSSQLEKAKADLHPQISFLLQLIRTDRVDEAAINKFESLKNTFCDVEKHINKARRRTTNFSGGLTPKPELKRNERARRAVAHYGNVVNTMDVTMDDSIHFHKKALKSVLNVHKVSDDNVRKRVAMSPIKMGDETRLSEGDEEMELGEDVENEVLQSTFVVSKEPSTSTCSNMESTTPISEGIQLNRRKARRTDLGPIL